MSYVVYVLAVIGALCVVATFVMLAYLSLNAPNWMDDDADRS